MRENSIPHINHTERALAGPLHRLLGSGKQRLGLDIADHYLSHEYVPVGVDAVCRKLRKVVFFLVY